jgi:exonuclease VII small subunit
MSNKREPPTSHEVLRALWDMVEAWEQGWFDVDNTPEEFDKGIEVVNRARAILERQRKRDV